MAEASKDPQMPTEKDFEMIWEQYQKKIDEEKEWLDSSIDIHPQPGFVLKAFIENANMEDELKIAEKTFINICHDPSIGAPVEEPGETEGESKLRIPLSCGAPRREMDKEGQPCLVFDVVFNPETVKSCERDNDFRDIVSAFACRNIQEKYKLKFSQKFKYPKMNYKGNLPVPSQRIRKPQTHKTLKSLLQGSSIASASSSAGQSRASPAADDQKRAPLIQEVPTLLPEKSPVYTIQWVGADGKVLEVPAAAAATAAATAADHVDHDSSLLPDGSALRATIHLPEVENVHQLSIEIGPIELYIASHSSSTHLHNWRLEARLPYRVREEQARAEFHRHCHELRIIAPVHPHDTDVSSSSSSVAAAEEPSTPLVLESSYLFEMISYP